MTTSQHTPGPWHIVSDATVSAGYGIGTSRDVPPLAYTKVTRLVMQEQANARLIAAAPELLAALQNIMAMYDSLAKAAKHDADCPCYHCQARAAIAKATGA